MRFALPLLLAFTFLAWLPLGADERLLNTIAIVVNDGYLTLYDVKKEIAPKAPDAVTDNQIAERKKEITDKLVGDLLMKQEIKKRNITVSDAELDLAIENVAERNRITVDKLKEEIAGQGMAWETYRNEVLRRQLEILSLKRDIAMATLDVDETTLRDLYRRHFTGGVIYSASHIILQVVQGASDADIYDRIVDIHRAVQNKKLTFEEAAERYSEDAAARNGGKLPSFRFNEMDPKFSEEVAKLDTGEMSRPFRSRFGWHIVRLDDVEKSDPPPYEQVREKVRYLFYQMNQEKAFESWIKAKRQSSAVKVLF